MIEKTIGGTIIKSAGIDPNAPDPVVTKITRLEFMDRFTDAELAGVFTAAKSSVSVEVFIEKVKAASHIDLTDPRTISGVQALEVAELIAPGRADEILAVQ
ncbi:MULTISPECIES: hypothetical protein [unclassified Halobacteriovorax]|uniref:hypothetical protein n=1 Tax=unclassified Halobacteriovorax TaxID=2639665 RepID=UPI00399AF103